MSTQTAEPPATAQPNIVEMEETVSRIRSQKGVEAVIIMDRRGAFLYVLAFYTGLISVVTVVHYLTVLDPNTSSS